MAVDPQVKKFMSENLRPFSEQFRSTILRGRALLVDFEFVKELIPNTKEIIEEGRDIEGITPLTGEDVHNYINLLSGLKQVIPLDDVIAKPCVRPVQIS